MPQERTSSIKARLVAASLVLICAGAASFVSGVVANSSLTLHAVFFALAALYVRWCARL